MSARNDISTFANSVRILSLHIHFLPYATFLKLNFFRCSIGKNLEYPEIYINID